MSHYLPVRSGGHARRRKPIRRASRGISEVQAIAVGVMAACVLLVALLLVAPVFRMRTLDLEGARFTALAAVEKATGMDEGGAANAFSFRSDDIAARLVRLPAVRTARIDVRLPGTLVVALEEREPKLIWTIGAKRYVVDESGLLFGYADDLGRPVASDAAPLPAPSVTAVTSTPPAATPTIATSPSSSPSGGPTVKPASSSLPAPSLAAPPRTPDPAPASGGGLGLPVVVDRRASDAKLTIGDYLDPMLADAAYRVGRLTPAVIGSAAKRLVVVVDDTYGVTLTPVDGGWVADFGFYTSRRTPESVPVQVQALHAALSSTPEKEPGIAWIWLMGDIPGGENVYLRR